MRVLVTGGTGFLGRHVLAALEERDHHCISTGSGTDLRNPEYVYALLDGAHAEVLVHLACPMGGGNVKYAGAKEADLLRDMLQINLNVFEAARLTGVKRIITIGSVCEYPEQPGGMFDEPWTPSQLWDGLPHASHRAYGLAKRMLAEQGRTYAEQYGMQVTHLILSNLYGPGDKLNDLSHFIPATIKKMLENPDQVVIWGTGEPTRDFLYVEDAAVEIVDILETSPTVAIANLCSQVQLSIADVVNMLKVILDYKGRILWDHSQPNGEMHRAMKRTLDPVQMLAVFPAGLALTIEWVKAELAK